MKRNPEYDLKDEVDNEENSRVEESSEESVKDDQKIENLEETLEDLEREIERNEKENKRLKEELLGLLSAISPEKAKTLSDFFKRDKDKNERKSDPKNPSSSIAKK